jgi:hypothetical protein
LSSKTINEKVEKLKRWIWKSDSEIPRNRLSVSKDCILDIIDLVERRRVYFYVFHGINMSEWNEIALYCFWVAKLHPFSEVPPLNVVGRQVNDVNAWIAMRMLLNAVTKIRESKGRGETKMPVKNLVHAFRYRDISKEAVMAIFEALIVQ